VEPEPQFNHQAKQERAWSRRLKLILALGLGPSLILAVLGYYDAAGKVFLLSLCAGFFTVYILEKLVKLDPVLEAFETPCQKLLLLTGLVLYLGYLLTRIGWEKLYGLFWVQ
jgi:hypothetical protein